MKLFIVCLLLLPLNLMAKPGFMEIQNDEIPSNVRKAASSVYKLFIPAGESKLVSLKGISLFRKKEEDPWIRMQIGFCKRTNQQECLLFEQIGEGTAFSMGSHFSVYSAMHNFYDEISYKSKKSNARSRLELIQELQREPIVFAMSSYEHQSVINPAKDFGFPQFFNPSKYLLRSNLISFVSTIGRVSDIIKIRTEKFLNNFLTQAKLTPRIGEQVYVMGYPSRTVDRKSVGAEDSDGESLRVSTGSTVSFEEWERISGTITNSQEKEILVNNFLYTDADCVHGNSGGPALNSEGEVIGIVIGTAKNPNVPTDQVCIILKTLDQIQLGRLWKSLD